MTTLISKPVTLSVIPGTFGTGISEGTLQGDVWAPGRDAAGVVNQVSWNRVPQGRWVSVDGTQMEALDTRIKAQMPNWRELSTWDRYVNSWSSMAPDLAHSRVFFSGGGHQDGSNNGLYSFNFYRMQWDIEMLPSDQSLWSDGYRNLTTTGGWGSCPESAAAMEKDIVAGRLNPINGWGPDEIFWDNATISGGPGIGRLTPKHTYHSYVYVQAENAVVFIHSRLWKINLDARTPVYKRQINDSPGHVDGGGVRRSLIDPEHGLAIFDEGTNEILISASGSSGVTNRATYNLKTDTWSLNPSTYSPPWGNWGHICNARVGRNITVIAPPNSEVGGGATGRYWVYNLDSRTIVISNSSFQYSGGLTGFSNFVASDSYYDGSALEYIAPINRYWMWTKMSSGTMQCIEVDPTTTPWTLTPKTFVGNVPTPNQNMLRKMFYLADMNAVWLYDRASLGWYVYKL